MAASRSALLALILRDLVVLRKNFVVRHPHARTAVPARIRLLLRLPHDRPRRRRRWGRSPQSRLRHRARARRSVGSDRSVPRRPQPIAVNGPGVRLHARDRPGASAVPDLARRRRKGALGATQEADRRADRLPDRLRRARQRRRSPPVGRWPIVITLIPLACIDR